VGFSLSSVLRAFCACAGALQLPIPALSSRRAVLGGLGGLAATALAPPEAHAAASGSIELPDALDDLPRNAKKAYLQYLPQLQLDGDFFVFELEPLLAQPGRWDRISEIVTSTDIGSAASISRLEREFITPMRQIALAFPPDMGGEDMQTSIDKFQKAMYTLASQARKGATNGITAPPSAAEVKGVEDAYNSGRTALNSFFAAVNEGVGAKRLVPVTKGGIGYPRSKGLYTQLKKDAALCRNRGGEALAGIWGNLMVYGTVPGVNPCGNAAERYFSQGLNEGLNAASNEGLKQSIGLR